MSNKIYSGSMEAGVSNTKLRVEQIKSEDGFTSLSVDLEALRGQVKDIIGSADYKEEITGEYAKVQIVDLAAHLDASGASSLSVKQAANVVGAFSVNTDKFTIAAATGNTMVNGTFNAKGAADLDSTLNVDGAAVMKSTLSVTGSADFLAAVVARSTFNAVGAADLDSTLNVDGASDLHGAVYAYSTFRADGAVDINAAMDVSGASDLHGAVKAYGTLEVDGESTLASAIVEDLTNTRVTFAGAGGALVDDAKMTFASGVLTVSGSTFSKDVTIVGNLTVQGATTTVDTQNLIVADAKIVISSGGRVDGAGIYLASDSAGENIRWSASEDKWIASDKFAADVMQALDLSSALVWADASGNLTEVLPADLGAAVRAELAGTSNQVSISAADAVTGISTISLPQNIHSGASPTFVAATLSGLTASRLMASDASKATVSIDLINWVTGTVNRVSVADDGDGSVTLSAPQDIHTGASPTFAAMNFGSYGAIVGVGGGVDLKLAAVTGSLKFDDSFRAASTFGQPLKLAGAAGEWDAIETAYGAEKSLLAMLAAAAPSTNKRYVWTSASATGTDVVLSALDAATFPIGAASYQNGKSDVFVNGQLMAEGSGKDFEFAAPAGTDRVKIIFAFSLQSGDVVTLHRYPAA
jgi:hypothetical protein